MVSSLIVMGFLSSVEQGWKLLIGLGAGTGLVFILRWYWWRVNAWSEISAMIASFVTSVALGQFGHSMGDPGTRDYAYTMVTTVGITTAVWLAVTFLTAPESAETLDRFYRRVRPGGPGWRRGGPAPGLRRPTGFRVGRYPGSTGWPGSPPCTLPCSRWEPSSPARPCPGLVYGAGGDCVFLVDTA